ncbi:MAG TPA: ABC transporter permease, partial [Longimicrobiales bacterium]|nr:ABC transporter permease [Longimicrobiales bacterium]
VRDLRFALRGLRRTPGPTLVAVLTLAVGIGATTAMFSVVHGVLLRPLPYPEPHRLVSAWEVSPSGVLLPGSYANFADWRQGSGALEALAAYTPPSPVTVLVRGGGVRASFTRVSADFFRVAGVDPARGRIPTPEEHRAGGPPLAVVGHAFWRDELGGPDDLAGTTVSLLGTAYEVVGVMPPGFDLPDAPDVWVSLDRAVPWTVRGNHVVHVLGRLAPGATEESAGAELHAIHQGIRAAHADEVETVGVRVRSYRDEVVGDTRGALTMLLAAAAFLLLVACTNVAGAQLARGAGRRRELAVRASLGAGRGRLVRQLLAESLVVAALGGLAGVGIARLLLALALAVDPVAVPRFGEVGVDGPVLLFAAAAVVATALASGLLPALHLTGSRLAGALRSGGRAGVDRRAVFTGRALMAGEVALALVLLAGAGLTVRSLSSILSTDGGFRTAGVLIGQVHFPAEHYATAGEGVDFLDALLGALRARPAVAEAGLGLLLPVRGSGNVGGPVTLEDGTLTDAVFQYRVADAGLFRTLEVPLVRGRLFQATDGPDDPHVALVDEAMADRLWPGEDPLGRRFNAGGMDPFPDQWLTVVGVVGEVRNWSQEPGANPTYYVHYRQRPTFLAVFGGILVARGPDADAVGPLLREVTRSLDPDVPVRVASLTSRIAGSAADRRFTAFVLAAFGLVALLLAAVGVYGVVACSVARRTREIGIRVALGAAPERVRRRVVGEALSVVGVGAVAGVMAALALSRLLAGLLHGVGPLDPLTHGAAAAVLLGATALASWIPARRGTRVDPTVALRAE